MIRKIGALGLLILTCACGKIGNLEPKNALSVPPKAYGQNAAPTAQSLTTPQAQARPSRSDELLRRSLRRQDDDFDLPPSSEPEKNDSPADQTPADQASAPKAP